MTITGPHNNSHPGQVTLATSPQWSCRRAWHGDTVKVYLHAELTKPDPATDVQIHPKGTTTNFDAVSGKSLSAYASGCNYEINWKNKPYAQCREFELKAKVDEKLDSDVSPSLYVDLDDPQFSI